jgi:DNA-binding Lrp family transcriptional regulator
MIGEMDILDRTSRRILRELQLDARQSAQQLADKVGLSSTPCWRRVKQMESEGVIRRYTVHLDREALGWHVCVLAHVTLGRHTEADRSAFEEAMRASPQVTECFRTTGGSDYVVKVLAADMKDYDNFLDAVIFKLPCVGNIHSNVVLREVKTETVLPTE